MFLCCFFFGQIWLFEIVKFSWQIVKRHIQYEVSENQRTTHVCGIGNHVCSGSIDCRSNNIMVKELSFYKISSWYSYPCCQYWLRTDTLVNLWTYSATIFDLCSSNSQCNLNDHNIDGLPDGRWYSEIGYECILPGIYHECLYFDLLLQFWFDIFTNLFMFIKSFCVLVE